MNSQSIVSSLFQIQSDNMKTFLNRICKHQEMQFDPRKWGKQLGHQCEVCSSHLTHQKCISLCNCYYFYHQKCFIQRFQSQLKHESIQVKCKDCLAELQMNLEVLYQYAPSFTLNALIKLALALVLLIINLVAIALTLGGDVQPEVLFLLLYFQVLSFTFLVYLAILYSRECLYMKTVKIKQLASSRLQLQTSAFKDMDLQTSEQMTKDYLSIQSKK